VKARFYDTSNSTRWTTFYAMFQEEQRQHDLGLVEEGYSMDDTADIIGCSTRSLRGGCWQWQSTGRFGKTHD